MRIKNILFFTLIYCIFYSSVISSMKRFSPRDESKDKKNPHFSIPLGEIRQNQAGMSSSAGGITSRSDGKLVPQTIEELNQLVRAHASDPCLKKKQKVTIADESSEKSDKNIDKPVFSKNKHNDAMKIVEKLVDEVHIDPRLLVECRYRYHGEKNKTPRTFEWVPYEKIGAEEYKELVKELFVLALERIHHEDDEHPEEHATKVADLFVDKHVGILKDHIDRQEDTIKIKNRNFFIATLCGVLQTLIIAGVTVWAAYIQSHPQSSDCPTNATMTNTTM
jgi:hypothetical protein